MVRSRQDAVAADFDDRLHEVLAGVRIGVATDRGEADSLFEAWNKLGSAWRRTIALDDPDIEERVSALDMALFIGAHDVRSLPEGGEVNLYPVQVATRDLRHALGTFQRHQPLPHPEGPTSAKLIELRNLNAACEWLIERGVL